jgi:carbamoylphosphate synthase small subunit
MDRARNGEGGMTDIDSRKLVKDLREHEGSYMSWLMEIAADKIEELEIKIKHLEAEVEDERQSHKATIRDMAQLSASCNAKIYDDYDENVPFMNRGKK